MIKEQIGGYLTKTVGYREDQLEWVPISGLHGDNIDKPLSKEKAPWYNGPTLFEALDRSIVPKRNANETLRVPVLDRSKEQYLFIYGKIESGIIKENQTCTLMPTRKTFKVKQILNSEDKRMLYALPGENVKIGVKGLEEEDVKRGNIICNNDDFCQLCNEFEANLRLIDFSDKSLLSAGFTGVLHMHTAFDEVVITNVLGFLDKDKNLVKSKFLKNGQLGVVRIKSESIFCVEKPDRNQYLGTFVLRDQGK